MSQADINTTTRIRTIIDTIREEERRLREKYTFLKYQSTIGLTILLLSLAGMIGSGIMYYFGVIPAWLTIIISAIFASFSHELEHDLIHRQYFKKNAFAQNFMMLMVWCMRPNTVNPWYRRKIHYLHHKESGTEQDLEERLVGNGIGNIFVRIIVMLDGFSGLVIRRNILAKSVKAFSFFEILRASKPLTTLHFSLWYSFLFFHGFDALFGHSVVYPGWLLSTMDVVSFVVVVLIAPNVLRSGSLNIVTSYMHYYGGVNNLIQQTQILRPWFLWPLQIFCFNFGSTHGIHHFVVSQPFYIRQMVAKVAHKVMRENGVRYNDYSTFFNANRYIEKPNDGEVNFKLDPQS